MIAISGIFNVRIFSAFVPPSQIFTTWYEADCGNGGYFRPCALLSDVTTGINDCKYACACADTGCEVALADRKDDNVHVCEVAIVGN